MDGGGKFYRLYDEMKLSLFSQSSNSNLNCTVFTTHAATEAANPRLRVQAVLKSTFI